MRTNLVTMAASLLISTALAVPVVPVSGGNQGTFSDLNAEATSTDKQKEVPAVHPASAGSGQDPPPTGWAPSSSSGGGWGEDKPEPAKGWGAPKPASTQSPSSWSGQSAGSRPGFSSWGQDSATSSQPSVWSPGGSFGAPSSAGQAQGLSPYTNGAGAGLFGNRPGSSPTSEGGMFGGSRPDAASSKPSSGLTSGWGFNPNPNPKPAGSKNPPSWGGNAPAGPLPPSTAGPSWTSSLGGNPPRGSAPPPSSGSSWGQALAPAPAPAPASGGSWSQAPVPAPASASAPPSGASWGQAPPPPAPLNMGMTMEAHEGGPQGPPSASVKLP
ncbi:hypothetical protein Vi05172_g7805 [Venturia inaequalis]|nr:hypothetical protein Vi05172_g7805 [Venturia inaequalis]